MYRAEQFEMLTTFRRASPRGVSKPLPELVDAGRLQLLQSAALAVADRLWSDGEIHLEKLKEVMVCWACDVTIIWENDLRFKSKWCDEGLLSNLCWSFQLYSLITFHFTTHHDIDSVETILDYLQCIFTIFLV